MDAGVSFEVKTSEASTAILLLPNYSTRCETLNKEYARRHGVSWYNYVNGSLGRNAPNGSLYLITGCDKTATWGNAVVGRTDRSFTFALKCTLMTTVGGTVKVANSWINDSGVEDGLFPIPSTQYPYPTGLQNQCVFARGFIISLSETLFSKSRETVLHPIDGSFKDRIPSFDTKNAPLPQSDGKTGVWTRVSSFFGFKKVPRDPDLDQRRILAESPDHESLVAEVSEFPTAESEVRFTFYIFGTY